MGKTSSDSKLNLPGRYAWAVAEAVGPLNLIFVMYSLPQRLKGLPSSTGLFGTGLPIQNEILGLLYVLHYFNRAFLTPIFLAPSMSPIHPSVSIMMAGFQYINSANIGSWLTYSAVGNGNESPLLSLTSVIGMVLFITGLTGNFLAENTLFDLRRGAAKRKAKSEGRAIVTYDKVYAIPPAQGFYKYVMFPHYSLEWLEWTGYWILGAAWGLGWNYNRSAALWFLVNEFATMAPRAYDGLAWYNKKFGVRAVGGRKAVLPGLL